MTAPYKPDQPQGRPPSSVALLVAVALVALFPVALVCLALCAGLLFFVSARRASPILAQAKESIAAIAGEAAQPQQDFNEFFIARQLTNVYKNALESVTADQNVIDRLGDPIETALDSDDLYRRQGTGPLNSDGEQVLFAVEGPKGKAQVTVIATDLANTNSPPAQLPMGIGTEDYQPTRITVTFEDGSAVEVSPRRRTLPPVR